MAEVLLWSTFGAIFALITSIFLILRHKSSLIFDIYPSKGVFYHLKYAIALLLVKHLRHRFYSKSARQTLEVMQALDKPQVLSDNPKSYDVVGFMAANSTGQRLMISLERRRQGINRAVLYLWLPEYGLLASPNLPDMLNFSTNGSAESGGFQGNGFHIYPKTPMKSWCLKYVGDLKQISHSAAPTLVKVNLDLEFNSDQHYFDYNRDLSGSVLADSVAREAWNESFYVMLKNVDKILAKRYHYEQAGVITGDININLKEPLSLKMNGFRDHSFGTERCLSTINLGYICSQQGVYTPITHSNFELYTYGEKGTPPKHQNFIVTTAQAKYFVQIKEDYCSLRYVGGNWESKVYNQFVSCTVNGIQGYGITEFLYRYNGGRPEEVCLKDPLWYQDICKFERKLINGENTDEAEVFFF